MPAPSRSHAGVVAATIATLTMSPAAAFPADATVTFDTAAAVTVLDVGDPSTAIVLSADWVTPAPVGAVLRNVEVTTTTTALTTADGTSEWVTTTELDESRTIITADDTGATVRVIVDSHSPGGAAIADAGAEALTPAEPRRAIVGMPALVTFDSSGVRTAAHFEALPEPTDEQLAALDRLAVAEGARLPAEPVGVGARWTAPFQSRFDGRIVVGEHELIEITDHDFTVTVTVTDLAGLTTAAADAGWALSHDSAVSATLTISRPGQPVRHTTTVDVRLQATIDTVAGPSSIETTSRTVATLTAA